MLHTFDNRLNFEWGLVCEGIWENVASGQFDGLFPQVVLQGNKAIVSLGGIGDNRVPVGKNLS
jgi:hypothetical protein